MALAPKAEKRGMSPLYPRGGGGRFPPRPGQAEERWPPPLAGELSASAYSGGYPAYRDRGGGGDLGGSDVYRQQYGGVRGGGALPQAFSGVHWELDPKLTVSFRDGRVGKILLVPFRQGEFNVQRK